MKNGVFIDVKEKIIPPKIKNNGYLFVQLYKNNEGKNFYIHRLVALYFIDIKSKLEVNHIDGNKENNYYKNLEFVTHSKNLKHAYDNNLKKKGEEHVQSKLTNKQVRFIKENYKPFDPVFGAKPLSEKFNVGKSTVSRIANGIRRIAI